MGQNQLFSSGINRAASATLSHVMCHVITVKSFTARVHGEYKCCQTKILQKEDPPPTQKFQHTDDLQLVTNRPHDSNLLVN